MSGSELPVLLSHWSASLPDGPRPVVTAVLPDGCQDLIWMQRAGECPVWFVAPLVATPYVVAQRGAVRYQGYRLRPGTRLSVARLLEAARRQGGDGEATEVMPLLADHAVCPERVSACLHALACAGDVAAAARALGVSTRTLARTVQGATGRPPVFWRRLARVRGAAQAWCDGGGEGAALAELAVDHGYADQAHFSRECRSWLGLPPGALRRRPDLREALQQSGYGTDDAIAGSQPPTGVQTSIRKPEGSAT